MRVAASIVLDQDKSFACFASFKKTHLNFIKEIEVPVPYSGGSICDYLRQNLESFSQVILEAEAKYLFKLEKIFLELPWSLSGEKEVEETVILKRRKRITPADISFAKKYLEDKFLDWDDICLHNIVLKYEIENVNYKHPPLGQLAKKIKLSSLLIWIKDKTYKEAESIFGNLNLNFGGFVAAPLSRFSSCFGKYKVKKSKDKSVEQEPQIAVSIDYGSTHFVIANKRGFICEREFDFGLEKILKSIAQRFMLTHSLASEVFYRYLSFKEIPYFKEITLKKQSGYVNLSTQTLNSFVKSYIKGEMSYMLGQMEAEIGEHSVISFIGRLNVKKGFLGFLKNIVSYQLKVPVERKLISSSFGCLQYGLNPFLENDHARLSSFWQNILNVYREYF